jgi:hypothetical protein
MPPTVYEASSVGASTFDKAASCWMMNLGQEDRQLIFSIFKLHHPSRNSLFHSAYSLAEILDASHMTILNHLGDSLGMKVFHFRSMPNQLTEQLSASRIQKCQELLPLLKRIEVNKFRNILTGDESWFMLEYQRAVKWSLSREYASKRGRQQISTKNLDSLLFGEQTAFMLLI